MDKITQGSWVEMTVKLEPRKDALGPFSLVDEQSEARDLPGAFALGGHSALQWSPLQTGQGPSLFTRATSLEMPLLATMIAGYQRNSILSGT